MAPAAEVMEEALADVELQPPAVPLVANVTGRRRSPTPRRSAGGWSSR